MNFTGKKYKSGRKTTDIAKLVRVDIKAAIKEGRLPDGTKTSVRSLKFPDGHWIAVYIRHLGTQRVINPAWVKWHDKNPHGIWCEAPALHTATASKAIKTIRSIVDDYNFDDSDPSTNYTCTNFSTYVIFDYEYREADEAFSRREGIFSDQSENAPEEETGKTKAQPAPQPLVPFPVFNKRHRYEC